MPIINIIRKQLPEIKLECFEPVHDIDLCADIDYLGWVGDKAIGIQIKLITSKANFGNYSASERMKFSFSDFTKKFGGKVFVVYSEKEKITNEEVIEQIVLEIKRLGR